jgi:hypothetical protein
MHPGDSPLRRDVHNQDNLALQISEVINLSSRKIGLQIIESHGVLRGGNKESSML